MLNKLAKNLTKASACNDGLTSRFCLVLGLQWGREGKRKLLNKLCVDYDYSCRFNGGELSDPSKSLIPGYIISVHEFLKHFLL
jgi:Adenylosuccinate synthetase